VHYALPLGCFTPRNTRLLITAVPFYIVPTLFMNYVAQAKCWTLESAVSSSQQRPGANGAYFGGGGNL